MQQLIINFQGLLSTPSAPVEDLEEVTVVSVRRSNGTLDSEFLDAGTPPPSYADVIACSSIPNLHEAASGTPGNAIASGKTHIYIFCIVYTLLFNNDSFLIYN